MSPKSLRMSLHLKVSPQLLPKAGNCVAVSHSAACNRLARVVGAKLQAGAEQIDHK